MSKSSSKSSASSARESSKHQPKAAAAAAAASARPGSKPKTSKTRHRKLSERPEELHVLKLRETVQHFPPYELRSRKCFEDAQMAEKGAIAGRTYKKTVRSRMNGKSYLLKKNAREDKGRGRKTSSADMDLVQNHEESFREVCATRLFQLIWGEPDVTPRDTKIVLAGFTSLDKPQNIFKVGMTKVYFVSQKIDKLSFNSARLSVENSNVLNEIDAEGNLLNQDLIDQLCEQTIIQCILSNADAIKFDNFYVDKESGLVVQFDFGDARNNEYSSPNPISILDSIRKQIDENATKSSKAMLAGNETYSQARSFFQKNISTQHILNVINRLEEVSQDDLWQTAYAYSYGTTEEKKVYADCFLARVRNFIKLKSLIERRREEEALLEEVASESHESSEGLADIAQGSKESLEGAGDSEEGSRSSSASKSSDSNPVFASRDYAKEYGSEEESEDASEGEDLEDELEGEEGSFCRQSIKSLLANDSEYRKDREKDDDRKKILSEIGKIFDYAKKVASEIYPEIEPAAAESESEEESSSCRKSPDKEGEWQLTESLSRQSSVNADASAGDGGESPLSDIDLSRDDALALIAEMEKTLSTSIDRAEEMPSNTSKADLERFDEDDGRVLKKMLTNFCRIINGHMRDSSLSSREKFLEYIADQEEEIKDRVFSFLTHWDSYQVFKEVQEEHHVFNEARAEKLKQTFGDLGVDVKEEVLEDERNVSYHLLRILDPQVFRAVEGDMIQKARASRS